MSYYLAIIAYTCATLGNHAHQVFGVVAGDLANIKLIKFCSNLVYSRLLIFLAAFVFDIFQVIGICHEEIGHAHHTVREEIEILEEKEYAEASHQGHHKAGFLQGRIIPILFDQNRRGAPAPRPRPGGP